MSSTRLLSLVVLAGCVLDRTGQSATSRYDDELAAQKSRVRDLESVGEDVGRRVAQLEEVTRARGQEEILKMETVDQLRDEVARMRGEMEQIDHDYRTFETAALGAQLDVDSRLLYLETRVAALEKSLGLRPPPPPAAVVATPPGAAAAGTDPASTAAAAGEVAVPTAAAEVPAAASAEDFFGIIQGHLEAGNGAAARAVAERFISENPKSDRVPEAYYRIGESYQNAGEFKVAATKFQDVIDRAPASTWAPWALLRQGECFDALSRPDDARVFYCDVVAKFPKSKAAKEAKAKCGK